MAPQELETYLRSKIPLMNFMQVSVLHVAADTLVVGAPLEPNLNVHHTFFGGSASALSLAAAWSLLQIRMTTEGLDGNLVVHRNTITYLRPVTGAVTAEATFAQPDAWPGFVDTLARKGRARITMSTRLMFDGHVAAQLDGEFVAVKPAASAPAA